MFGSEVIDTAIGLMFVFLLVSMLVTIVNELIAAALLSRAKWLRFGIARLIGPAWATRLYAHPLIEATGASGTLVAITDDRNWRGSGPSYLSSRSFADVLIHLVVEQDTRMPALALAIRQATRGAAAVEPLINAISSAASRPDVAPQDAAILADLVDRLRTNQASSSTYSATQASADIAAFVDAMPLTYLADLIDRIPPHEKIRKTLSLLLREAKGDIDDFKAGIEIWFDNAMDRVSGWYKRRVQWVAGLIAVVAAIGLNVDTMAIVGYLQTHAGVRDAVVAQAKTYAAVAPPASTTIDDRRQFDEATRRFAETRKDLETLDLPIGWTTTPATWSALGSVIALHWLGWLITALAATLGAPFWFDTLNRFISIRSAGKAPEEKPRAPKELPVPIAPGQTADDASRMFAAQRDG